jgi:fructose transport system ATP-binding protein
VNEPILEAHGLMKTYGRLVALDHVDFALYPGEVLAVVGDNGAGKSTLIKCLSAAEIPDRGVIRLEGREIRFRKSSQAVAAGIETVYQKSTVAPGLDVAGNLSRSRDLHEPTPFTKFIRKLESNGTRKPRVFPRKVMIFDEPTAPLDRHDSAEVTKLIRNLRERGTPVVVVSHDIPQALKLADRIHIQRNGGRAAVISPQGFGLAEVLAIMAGTVQVDVNDQALGPVR